MTISESEWEPLTGEEFRELETFLGEHHGGLFRELQTMKDREIVEQLPMLMRLLYNDMRRYQHGEPTRHIQFE